MIAAARNPADGEPSRRRRDDPRTGDTAVLLLTARAQEEDIEQGFAAGADEYLVKPFSVRELGNRVDALLARVRSVRSPG